MKTLSLLTLLLFSILNCKGQEHHPVTSKQDSTISKKFIMNRPKIDTGFEKFNIENFKDKLIIINNKDYETQEKYVTYKYEKETDSGTIRLYGGPKGLIGHIYRPKNSIYEVLKNYYGPSLIIKSKRIFTAENAINPSIVLGKEYQYDEQGHLVRTIDHDNGYDFSFEQAYEFVKTNFKDEKKLKEGLKYMYYFARKTSPKGQNYWQITFHIGHFPASYIETVLKLDAKTGKILSHKEYLYEIEEEVKLYKIIVPDQTQGETSKSTAPNTIYTTYKGKSYTEEEWKAFEQEHHNEYLRKRGREDEIKPVETPKTGNNNSSPGKKGAYENPQLGTPYTSPGELSIDKDIYQVYKGRYYTKAEWKEFHKSLPWWERLI
ncbi:MAG TPA: hypothetical protein VF677_15895 [Flavobacterium sp.]